MESKEVRAMLEAAQTGLGAVNTGFTALATPVSVARLCQDWLLMKETLSDVASAASELEMPPRDRLEYIGGLVRTALAAL